jgi:tetratricopeptide (TPR) repeat protein
LDKIKDNVYRVNIGDDVYNMMGNFYYMQGENDKALQLYLESISVFGDKAAAHNNAALVYEKQKNLPKALYHYQRSLELDKRNKFADKKIHALLGKPYIGAMVPIFKGIIVFAAIALVLVLISHRY